MGCQQLEARARRFVGLVVSLLFFPLFVFCGVLVRHPIGLSSFVLLLMFVLIVVVNARPSLFPLGDVHSHV